MIHPDEKVKIWGAITESFPNFGEVKSVNTDMQG